MTSVPFSANDSRITNRFTSAMNTRHPSIWSQPRTWGILSFVGMLFTTSAAFADAGETQMFVHNTTNVLRHMHASFQGTAIQHGYSDRELHFGVSVLMGAVGFQLAAILFRQHKARWMTAVFGFIFGMVPGVAKEFIDMAMPTNYFSWRDIAYDAAGVLTGLLLIWIVSHALAKTRQPLIQ